jgi:uncharacterized Zn finger protein
MYSPTNNPQNSTIIASREWWAQQWIDLLETSRFKKRLERARNYARQGNVLNIDFEGGKVRARVQGTDPQPYQVTISLDLFDDEQWGYIIETLSQKAFFSAQLLAGIMPQNIQEVFSTNGLSLFPFTLPEVHSKCSCPDQQVPCKHIGAVYYLLGDRFSEDPFVLFQLRGRTKEEILESLRQLRRASVVSTANTENTEISDIQLEQQKQQPTPLKLDQFWQYNDPLESSLVVITPAASSENILDILGTIPLASDSTANPGSNLSKLVTDYLNSIYQAVSQQAVISALNTEE